MFYIIFAVVGLWATISASVRPVSESALVGGGDLGFGTGPEPSVDDDRLQIGAAASIKVAFTSAGPQVFHSICTK